MGQYIGRIVLRGAMFYAPRSANDKLRRESPPYKCHWEHLALNNIRSFPFSKSILFCFRLGLSSVVFPVAWEGKASVCGPPGLPSWVTAQHLN